MRQKVLTTIFKYSQVLMLLVIIIGFSLTTENFCTLDNFTTVVMQQLPFLLIISMGMTMAIITKGIDLSILEHSFALDRAAGRTASTLIPAEEWLFGFYRPFGYEPFFRIARHEIVKKTRGSVPQRLSEQDIPQLAALYDRLAAPCRIARSPSCWAGQIALFDALGKGVYGWREAGKLAAYAFCWEDTAQEAFGMTPEREQGLLEVLRKDAFTYTACGRETALGCIKWHVPRAVSCGYMNLMLN